MIEQSKIDSLLNLYSQLETEINVFQQKTKLQCVSGCGKCCENPEVEVTVAEVLPLAIELWKNSEADIWLKKLEENHKEGVCVFYQPDPFVEGKGRCLNYQLRPLICRLFGFSAKRNKYNQKQLVTCAIIKNKQAREFDDAERLIADGMSVPLMMEYSQKVSEIMPELGGKFLPINKAIRSAIEKIGLLSKYKKEIN